MTQLEMNQQARCSYNEAKSQMQSVFAQLAIQKGESMPYGEVKPEEGSLYHAQQSWEKFSDADANAKAKPYKGWPLPNTGPGSIHAYIYLDAKTENVLARTAQLTEQLEKMNTGTQQNSEDLDVPSPPWPMMYVTENDYFF